MIIVKCEEISTNKKGKVSEVEIEFPKFACYLNSNQFITMYAFSIKCVCTFSMITCGFAVNITRYLIHKTLSHHLVVFLFVEISTNSKIKTFLKGHILTFNSSHISKQNTQTIYKYLK